MMLARPSVLSALLFGLLCAGQTSGAPVTPALPSGWQARLLTLLPQTAQSVTLLARRPSISTVDLELKVASVGGDSSVLRQIVVSAARGVKPTYDARLNVSLSDFQRYVVFQETLVSTGKSFRLAVTRDANRVTFGDGPAMNGVLRGVTIDLKTGEMRCPEGFSAQPVNVAPNNDASRGLEVRSGFQWKVFGGSGIQGRAVKGTLSLLQLASGRILLSYERTSMINHKVDTGELIVDYSR
ncbi:hypothetical protein GO986_15695 [Deinococcus sp. HMF7620]|uniref:Uncharacterized protein n=1 Tax=Deinococcus arboris TaxID=2682977 RepID=A0A7C9HT33_9DEIO|nr:hypothetical protein [Deinococcus arboris]MVN88193.1 hypothetical protein [Deinococcus arboris]